MLKRIFAWIGIIGFAFLIIDVIFLKYQIQLAIGIYILIIIYFVFSQTFNKNNKDDSEKNR
jgi:membrane protein implicated in regulation of membrane protease activity